MIDIGKVHLLDGQYLRPVAHPLQTLPGFNDLNGVYIQGVQMTIAIQAFQQFRRVTAVAQSRVQTGLAGLNP
ncbi:hypothetical protein SDC9_211808 [bioreactor metagenome]|uniref:Uncharacterized protein n=1 Tax=bioreactor metagenome TaxID=1076179 RepID=A0A645JL07_9ZZZZ